jgi:hypothetical protein
MHHYICTAQADNNGSGRMEAVKIAFITKELNLTPEEAQKFWPVYNNYFEEIKKARQENANDVVNFEESVVNIRKKYKGEFKRVLSGDERVNRIFMVENNFRDRLRGEQQRRLQIRRMNPGGKHFR